MNKNRQNQVPYGFVFLFFAVVFSASLALAAERVEKADTNKDGKPDEWKYYQGDQLDRIERDGDYDGKPEIKLWMKKGKPDRSEVDRNGDGKPDLTRFMEDGKPVREQGDLNFDGKLDVWSYYKGTDKDFMIVDKNYDGRPDAWFYYGPRSLKVIGGKMDEDFDGKIDKSFGAFPEEEKRQPW